MRQKNIKRAAKALHLAQGDDKNAILASRIPDKEVREIVKDQGRALVLLEKLILPQDVLSYEQSDMEELLLNKLKKKGHRIQDDEEEDTPEYAEEKRAMREAKLAKVPAVLGVSLEAFEAQQKEQEAEKSPVEVPDLQMNVLDLEDEAEQPSIIPVIEEIEDRTSTIDFIVFLGAILATAVAIYALLRR